jgi:signal transduction histidine kinase/sugar phosphate isomerase/epimerase
MKIGYQTITWGENIEDLEYVTACIAAFGFQGVEIAQRTDSLGFGETLSFGDLDGLLCRHGLQLVGLANGSLHERMDFCGMNTGPHYLCFDRWQDAANTALAKGFTVAFYPHAHTQLATKDIFSTIQRFEKLKWIPDSAHLTIIGQDPVQSMAISPERIAAVHLKDWTAAFGRSPHLYSKGFSELGRGDIDLLRIVSYLRSINYRGWLIAGPGSTATTPEQSMLETAEWLQQHGLLKRIGSSVRFSKRESSKTFFPSAAYTPALLNFSRELNRAAFQDVESCYWSLASSFSSLIPCLGVYVWIPNLTQHALSLAASFPTADQPVHTVQLSSSLVANSMERHSISILRISSDKGRLGASTIEEDWANQLQATRALCIPIFSPYNLNQLRLVISLYTTEEPDLDKLAELSTLCADVARTVDLALGRTCDDAAARTAHLKSSGRALFDYGSEVSSLIARTIRSEGCSLFFLSRIGDAIELIGTTGIEWHVPEEERFYRYGEGITGSVWQSGLAKIHDSMPTEPQHFAKSHEAAATSLRSCIWVPVLDSSGRVAGVVRCQNKRSSRFQSTHTMFSADDIAVIEMMANVAVPQIEALLTEEQRRDGVARLAHELQRPPTAILGAAELMKDELRRRNLLPHEIFTNNYIEDIQSWSRLMVGLVYNADYYGRANRTIDLSPRLTLLMADVVAPAVRQVEVQLRNRRLSPRSIEYSQLRQMPPLWIDRERFRQVMFNLLSNAIKYAYRDPSVFRIEIDGDRNAAEYVLIFRDWGEGVPAGFETKIFKEGFRAPRVGGRPISGQGLGLSVVNSIVQAHGGRVEVTSRHMPTEISIFLPRSLDAGPPENPNDVVTGRKTARDQTP